MATTITATRGTLVERLLPDRLLGMLALAMLAAVVVAVARGHAGWQHIPANIWVHLAAMAVALALTPVMLLRRKGNRTHRILGYVWVSAMLLAALVSLTIRLNKDGSFSVIHILSVYVLVMVPRFVWQARTHQVARHRSGVRGMVIGALLVAGFFTFPFGRLLGRWLLG